MQCFGRLTARVDYTTAHVTPWKVANGSLQCEQLGVLGDVTLGLIDLRFSTVAPIGTRMDTSACHKENAPSRFDPGPSTFVACHFLLPV